MYEGYCFINVMMNVWLCLYDKSNNNEPSWQIACDNEWNINLYLIGVKITVQLTYNGNRNVYRMTCGFIMGP